MAQRTTRPPRMGIAAAGGALVALIAIALIVGPCNDDDDPDPPDGARTSTAPTNDSTATTLSPEEEVEAAYLAYREMVTRLLEAPDPDDPEIAQRATGENRSFLTDRLTTLEALGQALMFDTDYEYSVIDVSVEGHDAVVHDCTVDDARTVTVANGQVISEGTSTQLLEATLIFNAGRWRVRTVESLQTWAGVRSCAN